MRPEDATISVCLERKFEELGNLSKEELENEVLNVLSNNYIPGEIEYGEPNKGVIGEIRVPVKFDEYVAVKNWHEHNNKQMPDWLIKHLSDKQKASA